VIDTAALLPILGAAPGRVLGRSRLVRLPDGAAACVPAALRGAAIGGSVAFSVTLEGLDGAGQDAALRFARALRQRAWRRLQGRRGLVPVALVGAPPGSATLVAVRLGGAAASPGTLDVLRKIFDDAALRQDLAWAIGARPGRAVPRTPRPQANEGQ
jgi:hypothetical protein